MTEPLAFRPPAETRISNEARLLASRLRRAEQRLTAAQEEADAVTDELTALHRRAEERFGRPITPDALLLDVLASIEIADGDVWLWRGTRNNHGLPTVKYVEGRRNQEKSVVRYLAIAFGVITDDDNGVLYPDEDADERTIRLCPYQACGWQFEEPPVVPIRDLTVEENVRVHIGAVEEACRAHLDQAHPGWTLRDLEREALQAQVRAIFNASPFSPTLPPKASR